MPHFDRKTRIIRAVLTVALLAAGSALAQAPPAYSPEQLDKMVWLC